MVPIRYCPMFDRIEWLKANGRTLKRGGFRASDADRRDAYRRIETHECAGGVFTVGAPMIGVILLIAGIGTPALVCFVGAVLLFVSAAVSLVTSQSPA
jgi:hypothetical protein